MPFREGNVNIFTEDKRPTVEMIVQGSDKTYKHRAVNVDEPDYAIHLGWYTPFYKSYQMRKRVGYFKSEVFHIETPIGYSP